MEESRSAQKIAFDHCGKSFIGTETPLTQPDDGIPGCGWVATAGHSSACVAPVKSISAQTLAKAAFLPPCYLCPKARIILVRFTLRILLRKESIIAAQQSHRQRLHERLGDGSASIGIVGLGYVGLALAVEFAEAGFAVTGVEQDAQRVVEIQRGNSYISDIPNERLAPLVAQGQLQANADYEALRGCDAISICVPTPLRKTKDPDLTHVISAVDTLVDVCQPGMLIVLESTTYPGTTEEIVKPRFVETGLAVGTDVFIAYSPERIDPGNQTYTLRNTPKVVGGVTAACGELARAYYARVAEEVVVVSSPTAAEMIKLLENTFRAVNIGLVNEMALMCDKLGLDIWEVVEGAATKPFGFMPFYPGPGWGGHCIPVDPHYLSWKLKTLDYNARFIQLASEINTARPRYVVERIQDLLNEASIATRGARIHLLGVAYKRDSADTRESPALDILELLLQRGAKVEYHDPYVAQLQRVNGELMQRSECREEWLRAADCVVILADHSTYDWQRVCDHARVILDTRMATRGVQGSAQITRM